MKRKCKNWMDLAIQSLTLTTIVLLVTAWGLPAQAAPTGGAPITGEIESIIRNTPGDIYTGGKMIVGGHTVILPRNLLIDLPANRLTLQQIFAQAPAGCVAAGQSGLAKTDTCNATGTGGFATISFVRTNNGDIIAGDVLIEKGRETVNGTVTYINYTDGFFRMNGIMNDATTGVMVRLNDPDSRHTIQRGLGCAGGPNCSPDPRFTLDPDNYTNAFTTGYPICIPSTVSRATQTALPAAGGMPAIPAGTVAQAAADGSGDVLCPLTNRTPGVIVENPAADSRRFAPIILGDSITAEGNFETIGGVRFLSTHTIRVNKALLTRPVAGQPDYLFLEEVFIEAPGFQNIRARAMWIGFTSLNQDVDIWSIHRDPSTNAEHEFPLASVAGCDASAGAGVCGGQGLVGAGANIFRIRYDVDFLMVQQGNPSGTKDAKLSPCDHLRANPRWAASNLCPGGATFANQIAVMSPVPHEIIARTGRKIDSAPGSLVTLDINGAEATNGTYLFPLGLNLGGIETAEFNEIDLNLLFTPTIFEGIPWNLDRRLSPGGCLDNAGNPGVCPAGPQPLDPFPFTGLDPRSQAELFGAGLPVGSWSDTSGVFNNPATNLSNIRNRIFSYVDGALGNFNGNATVLPCGTGVFPANCPLDPPVQGVIVPIAPVPLQCVSGGIAPVAQNDTAVTNTGVAVTIPVLFNDSAPVGVINFASVTIVSGPTGTAIANPDGTVTFTPSPGFTGTTTFTYTVAELAFGGVSNIATVTITVIGPPVAVNDSAVTNRNVPVVILALANDAAPGGAFNPASILVTQLTTSNGIATANVDGTITYTPTIGFSGNDTFTYSVANTVGARSNAATVSVLVNNVTTLPLAVNDAVATTPTTTVVINILANDQAFGATLDPTSVLVSALTPTTMGSVVSDPSGSVTYVPAPGFAGPASFTYTVNDSLLQTSNSAIVSIIVNSLPTANPDIATTPEDTAITIDLAVNDIAQIGAILPASVVITTGPAKGVVTNPGTGSVTYTPNLNANGIDTFTYTVNDSTGGVSLPGTVTVTVTAVNDPPTAGALNLTVSEDVPGGLPIILAGTDPDIGDTLTYTITGPLLNGTLTGTPPNMTYTPNLNFNGPASFAYTVSDNGVPPLTSAPATVNITVTPVNDAPITVNDAANTAVNTSVAISVLANDTDVDGTIAASTVAATQPANGAVTVNAVTGVVTYTPTLNFTGTNTFTYTVADNLGAVSAPATVTVTVAGGAPVAETVAVVRAQFRTVTPGLNGDWRVDGTGTPGALVTVYVGNTAPGAQTVGSITITAAGTWSLKVAGSTILPGPTNTVSVRTGGGATRLAFPVAVR